jgi:hypothetical protein
MLGTIPVQDLEQSALAAWAPLKYDVCVEYPQLSVWSSTAMLRHAIQIVQQFYPRAYVVRPSVWKTSATAFRVLPRQLQEQKLTVHERDAYNIARWYREYRTCQGKRVEHVTQKSIEQFIKQGNVFRGYMAGSDVHAYELAQRGMFIQASSKSQLVRQFYAGHDELRENDLFLKSIKLWQIMEDL